MKMLICLIGVGLVLAGCAIPTSYLPTDSGKTYIPTTSVEVFWDPPGKEYIKLGLVVAEDYEVTDEALFEALKKKAMEVGAHGLIMKSSSQQTGTVGVPVYGMGGSIMAPFAQKRLEGLAIRFLDTN